MTTKREPIIIKGRNLGIAVLTVAQLLIGVIHILFGLWLLSSESSLLHATVAYDIYTVTFGALVLIFAIFIWNSKYLGFIGTIAVSFRQCCRRLNISEFAKHPGHSNIRCSDRNRLQHNSYRIFGPDKVRKKILV